MLSEFTLEAAPTPDRLPPMLFLAALVHGILIIGVTFNAVLGDEFAEVIDMFAQDDLHGASSPRLIAGERDQRQRTSPFDRAHQFPLVFGAGPRDTARQDLAALRSIVL